MVFDVIVVTASTELQRVVYQHEMETRKQNGVDKLGCLFLTLADPQGQRIGSGGATILALQAASHLIAPDAPIAETLSKKRILVLHSGGDSQRIPLCSTRGKAFTALPSLAKNQRQLNAPIAVAFTYLVPDFLIKLFVTLAHSAPIGCCFVASTDILLTAKTLDCVYDWPGEGICGLSVWVPAAIGPNHGVFVTHESQPACADNVVIQPSLAVKTYIQKGSISFLDTHGAIHNGRVRLDSGLVYLSAAVVADLVECLHFIPANARFELYSDIMCCASGLMSYNDYMSMAVDGGTVEEIRETRKILWKQLNRHQLFVIEARDGEFGHLVYVLYDLSGTTKEYLDMLHDHTSLFRVPYALQSKVHSWVSEIDALPQNSDCVMINSLLFGDVGLHGGAMIENCRFQGPCTVNQNSIISGVSGLSSLNVPSYTVLQQSRLSLETLMTHDRLGQQISGLVSTHDLAVSSSKVSVLSVVGLCDPIKRALTHAEARFCGQTWHEFFRVLHQFNITPDVIWAPNVLDSKRTLWNARLFPVLLDGVSDKCAEAVLWLMRIQQISIMDADKLEKLSQTIAMWLQMPRLSFQDILACSDPVADMNERTQLAVDIDCACIQQCLMRRDDNSIGVHVLNASTMTSYDAWIAYIQPLLVVLDGVASTAASDIAGRALCIIGDLLETCHIVATYAVDSPLSKDFTLVTRSGPCDDANWMVVLRMLRHSSVSSCDAHITGTFDSKLRAEAVSAMADLRQRALSARIGIDVVLSARYYDGAWQLLIRETVERVSVAYTSNCSLETKRASFDWHCVTCPVRIDLGGAWSDTPPICFEHGGCVVNMAVTLDGEHPIGANARRIAKPILIFRTGSRQPIISHSFSTSLQDDPEQNELTCHTWDQVSDFENPLATAALLKACCFAIGVVAVPKLQHDDKSLQPYLLDGVGLEVHSWSRVPRGSGLGTSSILAAAVLQAIACCIGRCYDSQNMAHLVLRVEQLMTTGGGWQDQVGGICPGFKLTYSRGPRFPLSSHVSLLTALGVDVGDLDESCMFPHLCVHPTELAVSPKTCDAINDRLVLIYTGCSRLAKYLLQSVLRRWYSRGPGIVQVVDDLCDNALAVSHHLLSGDLVALGTELSRFWSLKKLLASDAEPPSLTHLLQLLTPHALGLSVAGAGGGGFVVMLCREPLQQPLITKLVEADPECKRMCCSVHKARLDCEGMKSGLIVSGDSDVECFNDSSRAKL